MALIAVVAFGCACDDGYVPITPPAAPWTSEEVATFLEPLDSITRCDAVTDCWDVGQVEPYDCHIAVNLAVVTFKDQVGRNRLDELHQQSIPAIMDGTSTLACAVRPYLGMDCVEHRCSPRVTPPDSERCFDGDYKPTPCGKLIADFGLDCLAMCDGRANQWGTFRTRPQFGARHHCDNVGGDAPGYIIDWMPCTVCFEMPAPWFGQP